MYYSENYIGAVVADLGSGNIRYGYYGKDYPDAIVPSYLLQLDDEYFLLNYQSGLVNVNNHSATSKKLFWGIDNVQFDANWTCKCLEFLDSSLNYENSSNPNFVGLSNKPILLSEPNVITKKYRENLMEVLFENNKCPGVYFTKSAPLSAYSTGRLTALVVDLGSRLNSLASVINGHMSTEAGVVETCVAGDFLDYAFVKMVLNGHCTDLVNKKFILSDYDQVILSVCNNQTNRLENVFIHKKVNELRETLCNVSQGFFNLNSSIEGTNRVKHSAVMHILPDGTNIDISSISSSVGELLFNCNNELMEEFGISSKGGVAYKGLHTQILDFINNQTDGLYRKDLISNIFITGGVASIIGLQERLATEISNYVPYDDTKALWSKFKISIPSKSSEFNYSTWLGGSILASMPTFYNYWISRQEYSEHGPIIAHQKSVAYIIMGTSDLGVMGLGVMGRGFSLNASRNGFTVSTWSLLESDSNYLLENFDLSSKITFFLDLKDFINSLCRPRKILIMIPSGKPVDDLISNIKPFLDSGDILIDGGNEFYQNAERRINELKALGISYISMGISGGGKGALNGACIMASGDKEAYFSITNIFSKLALQTPQNPCIAYIGSGGSGHYVKMVHNGIEYAEMEIISEIYLLLKRLGKLNNDQIADIFTEWNNSSLAASYLLEITSKILTFKDSFTEGYLVDFVLDVAKSKGTGLACVKESLDMGIPCPTIAAALTIRNISSHRDLRYKMFISFSESLSNYPPIDMNIESFKDILLSALVCSKICAFAQGFMLMDASSSLYGWQIDYPVLADIWKGSIIRCSLLELIGNALKTNKTSILLNDNVIKHITQNIPKWKEVIRIANKYNIPIHSISSSLDYLLLMKSDKMATNIIQAQRDFFGAHGFQRIDRRGDFHSEWTNESR